MMNPFDTTTHEPDEPVVTPLANVQPVEIKWLWPRRIARGKISLIAGTPGLGKSLVTMDLAARVSTGGKWPCGEGSAPKGKIILLSAEDDVADTILPRFLAAGGDRTNAFILEAIKHGANGKTRRGFNLGTDLEHLEAAIKSTGDVQLVIIDPLSAYFGGGKIDTHRDADVRAVLAPFADLAARHAVAIVGVAHLNKASGTKAISRVSGSGAFVAAARASYLVSRDPQDEKRRLMLPLKNNLGEDLTGFGFKIALKTVDETPLTAPALNWEDTVVTMTADEALAEDTTQDGRKSESLEIAKNLIQEMLKEGPRAIGEIEKRAKELGISEKTLRNAKNKMGIKSVKSGGPGAPWLWTFGEGTGYAHGKPYDSTLDDRKTT